MHTGLKTSRNSLRLERRYSFTRFCELLFAQSGGVFEATEFSRPCEASRTTISNYLAILEATLVVHVIRPFSTHRATETFLRQRSTASTRDLSVNYEDGKPFVPKTSDSSGSIMY